MTQLSETFSLSFFFSAVETMQGDIATGDVEGTRAASDLLENMVRVVIF